METRMNCSVSKKRANGGFTLIEVLLALAMLVVLTFVFTACATASRKVAKMNGQYSQAISLCQHKIDQLRAVGYGRVNYTELEDAEIIDGTPTSSPYSFKVVDDVAAYLPSPTATVRVQSIASNQLKVTATVTWRNTTYQTKTSTMSLSAIIANME